MLLPKKSWEEMIRRRRKHQDECIVSDGLSFIPYF